MILVSKPFVAGDYILTGTIEGTVHDIGLVYTSVTTVDNKVIFIPNSDISGSSIVNYTTQTERRVDLTFEASYENSIDDVKYAIKSVPNSDSRILHETEPFVGVQEYKESSIAYVMRAWCKTEDYWPLYYKLQEEVKHAFDEKDVYKRQYR